MNRYKFSGFDKCHSYDIILLNSSYQYTIRLHLSSGTNIPYLISTITVLLCSGFGVQFSVTAVSCIR
jgi:hypothetical protein